MPPSRRNNRDREASEGETADVTLLTRKLLRGWPLPQPDEQGDKEERGRVLVVGGSPEMPGALLLAATAALRAGAGKLRMASGRSIAPGLGLAVPEGRVFALEETAGGAISPAAAERIAELANAAQSVLIGPGMVDEEATGELLGRLLPLLEGPIAILDAAALCPLAAEPECLHRFRGRAILPPHAGEMAMMLRLEKGVVRQSPVDMVQRAARQLGAIVALKGAETYIADPSGDTYCNRKGNVGLATSGSGDTLAGVIAGLAARGAEPLQAAAWGVSLHARAGDRLARRMGRLGFLARDLLDEIPPLMQELGG